MLRSRDSWRGLKKLKRRLRGKGARTRGFAQERGEARRIPSPSLQVRV
jgi:hypothetical protein